MNELFAGVAGGLGLFIVGMWFLTENLKAWRWARVRRAVLNRDGWWCRKCGRAGRLECDHVGPIDKGGAPWDIANLQTLCRGCHIEKTAVENRREQTPAEVAWRALVRELVDR